MTEIDNSEELPKNINKAVQAIQLQIKTGQYKPDQKIPSLRNLSSALGINRQTIWQAIKILEEKGWLKALPNGKYKLSSQVEEKIFVNSKVAIVTNGSSYIRFAGHQELYFRLHALLKEVGITLSLYLYDQKSSPVDYESLEENDIIILCGDVAEIHHRIRDWPATIIGINVDYSLKCQHAINPDSFESGQQAAKYALENGLEKIAIIGLNMNPAWIHTELRYEGFKHIWMESGNSLERVTRIQIDESNNNLLDLLHIKEEISKLENIDFFFCLDRRSSLCVVNILDLQKINIPNECRVIGYDVINHSRHSHLAISSFEQDFETIAHKALETIQSNLRGTTATKVPVQLIHRGTS
jgi:DNA-binding LacI/PurR family transcriptional regulator/DNA-binding transcriptional regulator YhcF (GntR family)